MLTIQTQQLPHYSFNIFIESETTLINFIKRRVLIAFLNLCINFNYRLVRTKGINANLSCKN